MFIKEESLFNFMTWLCLALSGLMISILFGENYFSVEQDSTVIISNCCKVPKQLFMGDLAWFMHLYIRAHLTLHFVGLVIQAAMFFKQRQLEKEQSAGQWVIHYDNGEIRIERKNLRTCNRKLSKHKRNVISPLGSFLSSLISAVYRFILAISIFFNQGPAGLPIISQFFFFSLHSLYFFGLNFIETVCSPTLRGSILNVIPRLRHKDCPYRVVNV